MRDGGSVLASFFGGGAIPAFGSASLIDIGVARTLLAATEGEDGSVALVAGGLFLLSEPLIRRKFT